MHRHWIISLALALFGLPGLALAEAPPQSVHWGAIAFPDHDPTLTLSTAVLDRFTEFDGAGKRYNDMHQTMGFNFFTVSWTKPLTQLPGWNLNLTAGGGPTRDGPSRFLQNDVVHKLRGFDPVPVGEKRDANDFMLSGTMTRWFGILGTSDVFFAGVGGAGGSLYYEPYVQAGFRRLAILGVIPFLGDYLRVSALGRYGRPFSGAAFHQVAPQSYLAQASVGLGNYQHWKDSTPWEIELAVTVDSGLFVDHRGDALEERFVSLALRYSAFTFETWNDLINQKDYGPTFGARLTLDLFYMYDRWFH
ncbi:hypothetical protein IT404_10845 [Candidatus Nomurabacteria bacterium]|nr:hypothetical protein [Candidatus Nomurabacteria bacterium]